ncbi:unnamed protein product [Paramecium sonneborni]|uniref:Uncharacterized protein n=1 Tax=Paramecium sonneborni TaxID=65129 RepID=A0A8S1R7L2_9CILI|nr:unnamed protein product [Paramecium sonneborni]
MDQINQSSLENDYGLSNQCIEEENQKIEILENQNRLGVEKNLTFLENQIEIGNNIHNYNEPDSVCYYTILDTQEKDQLIIILLIQKQQPLYVEIHLIKQKEILQCITKFQTQISVFSILQEQKGDFLKQVFLQLAQLSVCSLQNIHSLSMNKSIFLDKQDLYKFWSIECFIQYMEANYHYSEIFYKRQKKSFQNQPFLNPKYFTYFLKISFQQINNMLYHLQHELQTQKSIRIIPFLILHYQNSIFQNLMIQKEIKLEFFSQITYIATQNFKIYKDLIQSFDNGNEKFYQLLFYCFLNYQFNSFMSLNTIQQFEECILRDLQMFFQVQYQRFCENCQQNKNQANLNQKVFSCFLKQKKQFNDFIENQQLGQFLIDKTFLVILIDLSMVNISLITEINSPIKNYNHFRKNYIKIIINKCQQQHFSQFDKKCSELIIQKKLNISKKINLKSKIFQIRKTMNRIAELFPDNFQDMMFYINQPKYGIFYYKKLLNNLNKSIVLIKKNINQKNQNEVRKIIQFLRKIRNQINYSHIKGKNKIQYSFKKSDLQVFQKNKIMQQFIEEKIEDEIETINLLEKDLKVKSQCIKLLRQLKQDGY